MMWTNDPEADFRRHDRELAREEARLPECDCCGEHKYIWYEVFGHIICEDCIDDFKHEAEV